MVDRKRRRRGNPGHDINAAAWTTRPDAQRRTTEWGAGLWHRIISTALAPAPSFTAQITRPSCSTRQILSKTVIAHADTEITRAQPGIRWARSARACATGSRGESPRSSSDPGHHPPPTIRSAGAPPAPRRGDQRQRTEPGRCAWVNDRASLTPRLEGGRPARHL